MLHFAAIAGVVSVVVGWIVTIRLFTLARKNRALPERLLAIGFGGLFCVGYPFSAASRLPGQTGTHEGALLFAIGAIGMSAGLVAFAHFPRLVFRPGKTWAGLLAAALSASSVVAAAGCSAAVAMASDPADMVRKIGPFAVLLMATVCLVFLWHGIESLRYYRIMKRRLALGLARADTTHRFLLWAISSLASLFPIGAITLMRAAGQPILAPLPMALIASSALVTSTCWWLAFFMPDRYRARVLREASETNPLTE